MLSLVKQEKYGKPHIMGMAVDGLEANKPTTTTH